MREEELEIGYIRSNCLNKTIDLFKGKNIAGLTIERGQQERGWTDSPYPWIKYYLAGTGHFVLDWDIWRYSTPFEAVITTLNQFKANYHFDDFVVEKIEVGLVNDKKLCDIINRLIPINEMQKHPSVDENCRIFVTFVNTPLAYTTLALDGQSELITKINENAIVNLRFKKGILDLKQVKIERKKKEFENFGFLVHKTLFIERVLETMNTKEWYTFEEIKILPDKPTPCAVRTLEMQEDRRWRCIRDRSIKQVENGGVANGN